MINRQPRIRIVYVFHELREALHRVCPLFVAQGGKGGHPLLTPRQ